MTRADDSIPLYGFLKGASIDYGFKPIQWSTVKGADNGVLPYAESPGRITIANYPLNHLVVNQSRYTKRRAIRCD